MPTASVLVVPEAAAAFSYPALSGYNYQVEATADLQTVDPWDVVTVQRTQRYWQTLIADEVIDIKRYQTFLPCPSTDELITASVGTRHQDPLR